MSEWTIKKLRDYLGMDCHTSDHVLDMLVQEIEGQLAAERTIKSAEKLILLDEVAKNQQLREQLAAAHKQYEELALASVEQGKQLVAEREKYERSQEKVREYFDLLAAERAKPKT